MTFTKEESFEDMNKPRKSSRLNRISRPNNTRIHQKPSGVSMANKWNFLEITDSNQSFDDVHVPTKPEVRLKKQACLKKHETTTRKNLLYPLMELSDLTSSIERPNLPKSKLLQHLRTGTEKIVSAEKEEEYHVTEELKPEFSEDYKKYCNLWLSRQFSDNKKVKEEIQKVDPKELIRQQLENVKEVHSVDSFEEERKIKLIEYKKFLKKFADMKELYDIRPKHQEEIQQRKLDTETKKQADKCINELASGFVKFIGLLGGSDEGETLDEETIKNNLTGTFSKGYNPITVLVDEIKTLTSKTVPHLSVKRSMRHLADEEFSPKLKPDEISKTRLAQSYYCARHVPVSKWDERFKKIIAPPELMKISARKYYTGKTGKVSKNEIAELAELYSTDRYIEYIKAKGMKNPLFVEQIERYKNIIFKEQAKREKFANDYTTLTFAPRGGNQ